jgi:hypothetical protein
MMYYLRQNRHRRCTFFAIIFTAAMLAVGPALAEEGEKDWQPPLPMPDDFDWIQLTSGEWLKGEIIAMYEDSLEFDSDELDDLTLAWEDIQHIRTAQIIQVAFLDGTIATGKLLVEGDDVRITGDEDYRNTRSQVLSLTAGAPKERNYWSGKLSAGLNYRTGNTEQIEFNAKAHFKRRTPANRINFDYLGNFTESDGITIADNQRASFGWNLFISKRFYFTPVYGEYFRDPFQNITSRWTLGAGLGFQIVDSSKITWKVDAALAYQRTSFDDVAEDEPATADTPALVIGTRYDNDLTGWMDYFFYYQFFVVNQESGTYTHHLMTGFEFDLFGDFDFDVSWVWDRIQDPRMGADGTFPEQDDFRTIIGLGFSF